MIANIFESFWLIETRRAIYCNIIRFTWIQYPSSYFHDDHVLIDLQSSLNTFKNEIPMLRANYNQPKNILILLRGMKYLQHFNVTTIRLIQMSDAEWHKIKELLLSTAKSDAF